MATESHNVTPPAGAPGADPAPGDFGRRSWAVYSAAIVAGLIGFAAALLLGFLNHDQFKRFFFSYLVGFSFFLAIALGALAFVVLQHVVQAGWSANVRRVAEVMAMTLPALAALSAPIFVSVVLQDGNLYPWAQPLSAAAPAAHGANHAPQPSAAAKDAHATDKGAGAGAPSAPAGAGAGGHGAHRGLDELTLKKRHWLNPWFFVVRLLVYFGVWSWIAVYYWRQSTAQDYDGNLDRSVRMKKWAGVSLLAIGLTITFASFDLLMSLDPHWYSTIFGVYFLSSCAVSFFAAIVVVTMLLQKRGYLRGVIDEDHYHDLGKFLFGFVFFWGYIAFSQYMLLWYANLPETTTWWARRGASTATPSAEMIQHLGAEKAWAEVVPDHGNDWRTVVIALLVGHLLIPFAGLLSRHVKRNVKSLLFWAVWLLVFHFVNMYWVVMPEMRDGFHPHLLDLACFLAVGGVVVAVWMRVAGIHRLRAVSDPRAAESLAFTNV